MTVSDIAQKVCMQLNLQDTSSLQKAEKFVKDRWTTIWNSHLWKDSVGYVNAQAQNQDGRCILRAPLERIRAVRYGEIAIAPVDPSNVFQLDPQAFDNYGEVCGFSELGKDKQGNRIAQIYRIPLSSKESFLIMGKIKCPILDNNDEIFLTGAEDALTEFAAGDMWKLDQQFSKAAACYANGSTFVEQMRKLDSEQSASNPRAVPESSYFNEQGNLFDD